MTELLNQLEAQRPLAGATQDDVEARMNRAMGCKTMEVALRLTGQLAALKPGAQTWSDDEVDAGLKAITAFVGELEPDNATQALLAVQMVGAQEAAMEFLRRSLQSGQEPTSIDRHVSRAARLMQLFTTQLEAMAKLKGKGGQQRVVVEHVTVNEGGQAIVGALAAATREGGGLGGPLGNPR